MTSAAPDFELWQPADDVADPEISIVIPALNEAVTIGEFVEWCKQGMAAAGVRGEILIVDSSTDDTPRLALAHGARVLRVPRRGLGRAYIDARPHARGRFLLFGDCDCTYDFRELKPFIDASRQGYEFVMGSRFRGHIEPGAMPFLHRYFGTPLTTWIMNVVFGSRFSDIHCGMRGITADAFARLDLRSQSWEYASEMVIKSVHLKLKTTEVPIHFLKDPEGRESHHKRLGWFSPWHAGWINLRAMFVFGAGFFLYRPGWLLLLAGLALVLPLASGPLQLGSLYVSLNWMLLGMTSITLGLESIYLGILARSIYDPTGETLRVWTRRFAYDRTVLTCAIAFLLALPLGLPFVRRYIGGGFQIAGGAVENHWALSGLVLMIVSFTTFVFTLVLHAVEAKWPDRR